MFKKIEGSGESGESLQKEENSTKKIEISLLPPKKSPKDSQKEKEERKIEKKERSKRIITNHNSWIEDLSFETQYRILNEVKTQYNYNNQCHRFFVSQIKGKIYGYSYQDEMKNKLSRDTFVDLSNVLQKLIDSNMECYYCRKKVKILYEYVREEDQWTLERIDNKMGHNNDNVEIACLSCNLRRRTMYHERYVFTKQMNIVKELEQYEIHTKKLLSLYSFKSNNLIRFKQSILNQTFNANFQKTLQ
jgi:hypothetical protein